MSYHKSLLNDHFDAKSFFFAATSLLIDNILWLSEFQTVINGVQNIRNVGWQVDKFCRVTSSVNPYI